MNREKKSPHITTLLYKERISEHSKLKISASKITPYILIDPGKELFIIKGKSSPEDTVKFYALVFLGLKNYIMTGRDKLSVHVSLTYFNSSTAKCLFDLMKILKNIKSCGIEVIVNWYYEEDDEDMLEAGEDYEMVCDISFNFVALDILEPKQVL